METDTIVLASAERLFADVADIQSILAAKDDSWKPRLWGGIEETGLNIAGVPEALGGVGLGLADCLAILKVAGASAVAVPLAETMMAGWMLGAAGLELPAGQVAFGPSAFGDRIKLGDDGLLSGRIERLSFARECGCVALLAEGASGLQVALVDLALADIQAHENLAYEPADTVVFSTVRSMAHAVAPVGFALQTTLLIGAAARAMQTAGALEKLLAVTAEYVTQRRAFERPITKFQAVQHSLAQLAGEVAVSLSAAASAAEALESLTAQGRGFADPELCLEIMSAKIRTAGAAQKGAAIAHQLHGAIGVTREHILHRLTLRVLAWRDDYGNESQWSEYLGDIVCSGGEEALWPLLAIR